MPNTPICPGTGKSLPNAVLIRAVEPIQGINWMLMRRNMAQAKPALTTGLGSMSAALRIITKVNGIGLLGEIIWGEDKGISVPEHDIIASPRVGVAYAGEDALRSWRFRIMGTKWTSPAK